MRIPKCVVFFWMKQFSLFVLFTIINQSDLYWIVFSQCDNATRRPLKCAINTWKTAIAIAIASAAHHVTCDGVNEWYVGHCYLSQHSAAVRPTNLLLGDWNRIELIVCRFACDCLFIFLVRYFMYHTISIGRHPSVSLPYFVLSNEFRPRWSAQFNHICSFYCFLSSRNGKTIPMKINKIAFMTKNAENWSGRGKYSVRIWHCQHLKYLNSWDFSFVENRLAMF